MIGAVLTLADGTKKPLALVPNDGALEIRERNGELPDNWNSSAWHTGAPVLFDALDVTLPDTHTFVGSELRGFFQVAPNQWSLIRPDQYKYHARRNGVDLYGPGVGQHHAIVPGDTLFVRAVPKPDPLGKQTMTDASRAAALKILDYDRAKIGRWPWLQKAIGWFQMDASSLDPATPPGRRNAGYLLNPYGFAARWHVPIAPLLHWYGSPASKEAGQPVLIRNEHYNADAAWIGSGLLRDDEFALSVGLDLLRQKIAYGLIDCDQPCRHKGLFRTEAGDDVRGTLTLVPSWAKGCFSKALAAGLALLKNDSWIQRGAQLHGDYLANAWHEWNGAGGARNVGHYLQALLDFWHATGDVRFKSRAESEIQHAMGVIGSLPYFPENPGSLSVSAGEGLIALAMTRRWVMEEGLLPSLQPKLDTMLQWALTHLWDSATGRWGYFYDGAKIVWSGDFQFCMGPTLLDLPDTVRQRSEAYCFTHYANVPDCDAAFGGEGPGWPKWTYSIATYGAMR